MDIRNISGEDWARFAKLFPRAQSFLVGASLRGELAELRRGRERATRYEEQYALPFPVDVWNDTREARLAELEEWHRVTTARMEVRTIQTGGGA